MHGGEVLRKVGAAVLAVPVLVAIYLATLRERGGHHRILAALGAAAVIAVVTVASLPPAPTAAVPASAPAPVTARMLDAVRTGHTVTAPIHVGFDTPMDAASVAGALRIVPDSAVSVSWDAAGKQLTHRPHRALAARHAVHGDHRHERALRGRRAARDAGPCRRPDRARGHGHDHPDRDAQGPCPDRHRLHDQARPCDPRFGRPRGTADRAHGRRTTRARGERRRVPLHAGQAVEAGDRVPRPPDGPRGRRRRAVLDASPRSRSRPSPRRPWCASARSNRTRQVDRAALLSVRFTQSMDREQTAAAFSVTADGKPVAGTTSWAEKAQVLRLPAVGAARVRGDRGDEGRRDRRDRAPAFPSRPRRRRSASCPSRRRPRSPRRAPAARAASSGHPSTTRAAAAPSRAAGTPSRPTTCGS